MGVPSRPPPSPLVSRWRALLSGGGGADAEQQVADVLPLCGPLDAHPANYCGGRASPRRRERPRSGRYARDATPELILQDAGVLHSGLKAVRCRGKTTREWVVGMAQRYEARIAALEGELAMSEQARLESEVLRGMHDTEHARANRYRSAYEALQQLTAAQAMQAKLGTRGPDALRRASQAAEERQKDIAKEVEKATRHMQRTIDAAHVERDDAKSQCKMLHGMLREKEMEVGELAEERDKLEAKVEEKREQLQKAQEEIRIAKERFEVEVATLRAAIQREKDRVAQIEEELKKAKEKTQEELAKQRKKLEAEFDIERQHLENERDEALDAVKDAVRETEAVREQLAESERRREAAEERAASADALRRLVVEFRDRVDAVLRQATEAGDAGPYSLRLPSIARRDSGSGVMRTKSSVAHHPAGKAAPATQGRGDGRGAASPAPPPPSGMSTAAAPPAARKAGGAGAAGRERSTTATRLATTHPSTIHGKD
eukprot:gene16830-17626_t